MDGPNGVQSSKCAAFHTAGNLTHAHVSFRKMQVRVVFVFFSTGKTPNTGKHTQFWMMGVRAPVKACRAGIFVPVFVTKICPEMK